MQQGNADKAIPALEKAIKYNSKFLQAYTTLANAYLMKGMINESIETNLKTLDLEPSFAVAHNNLAIAYLENGEYEMAVEHCDKAVKLGYEVAPEILKEIEQFRKKEMPKKGNA
jgi:tetratricopeptide (TPR) repeat protein